MIPTHSSLLLFVGAALVLLVIPGPAVFYITSRSIGQGRAAGLISALGIQVGTLVHVAAAAVGLSALLVSSAAAFAAVKYLGAAYLIYLGVQKLRRPESLELSGEFRSNQAKPHFCAGRDCERPQPKDCALFLCLSPAIRRSLSRERSRANSFLGGSLFLLGCYQRLPLGALGRDRWTSPEAQSTLDAHATLRLGRNADLARPGHRLRRLQPQALAHSVGQPFLAVRNFSCICRDPLISPLLRPRIPSNILWHWHLRISPRIANRFLRSPPKRQHPSPGPGVILAVVIHRKSRTHFRRSFHQRHRQHHRRLNLVLRRRPHGLPSPAHHVLHKVAHRRQLRRLLFHNFCLPHHYHQPIIHRMSHRRRR